MSQPSHLVLLVLLILSGPLFLNACGKNLTAEEYVLQAKEHLQTGDLRAANIELANALQRDPEAVEARWLMVQVALDLGDAPTAESEARRALQLGMSRAEVQPLLVEAVLRQGAFDRTLAETASLPDEATDADKASMLGLRGQAFVLKGDIQRAEAALEDALSFDPQGTAALVGLAALHALRGQTEDAHRWVSAALESNPGSPEAWTVLGELELAQGNWAEAEAAFGSAIQNRAYPTLDRAHRALARLQLEKVDEAAADIQALRRQGLGEHHYAQYVHGRVLLSQGNLAGAADAFEASFATAPSYLPNRLYLGTTRLMLGQPEQARRHAQYIFSMLPGSPVAANLLAAVRFDLHEQLAARDLLDASLRANPEDRNALRMLATISLLEGDAPTGLGYMRRLAALEPHSQPVQEMLMLARLMSGEALQDGPGDLSGSDHPGADGYAREFLLAVEAFRSGRMGEALQRARGLHERFPDRIDPINLMAAAYLAAGQLDLARTQLEKVLELEPHEPSASRNLAKVELQAGGAQRAKTILEHFMREYPDDEDAVLLLAQAEGQLNDLAAARQVLERFVERNPEALTARVTLAHEHLDAGNTNRVLALTSGLGNRQYQAQPQLLELRGKAQIAEGDLTAATNSFRLWARIAPESAEAQFLLGDSLARSADVSGARQALERSIHLDPHYLPARVGEIRLLVQLGELDRASSRLAELRDEFGNRPEVLGIEGWFALGTGDFEKAESALAQVWRRTPNSELTILLVRALWAQGKREEALGVMSDWLAHDPRDVAVLMQMADAYLRQQRVDEAIQTYRRVLAIEPENVPALNNTAWLIREEDPSSAMEYAERAYRLAPQDPYVLDTLGMLKLEKGEVDRAFALVSEALELAPSDMQIQLHLGAILVRQQRFDAARTVLEAVLTQMPDSEQGREASALLESLDAGS